MVCNAVAQNSPKHYRTVYCWEQWRQPTTLNKLTERAAFCCVVEMYLLVVYSSDLL